MAGYDEDWRRRERGSRHRHWEQPWASRRGQDLDRVGAGEYGMEYRYGGYPFGTGYPTRPEEPPRFRAGGTGYDFGYQGGEYGQPVNAPDFGTRGSYGRPGGYRTTGHGPQGERWPSQQGRSARRMDDDDIRESVQENLFQDSYVDPERIRVQVDRGVVTLTGEVDDFLEARYAWDDAWESPGVRGVINNLTVRSGDQPGRGGTGR